MGEFKGIIVLRFSDVLLEPRWVFQVSLYHGVKVQYIFTTMKSIRCSGYGLIRLISILTFVFLVLIISHAYKKIYV